MTGFLVPTADVLATTEQVDSIQAPYQAGTLSYDTMVALRSLGVVVDVDALRQALATLADDPALASRMGLQGAQRLREHYAPSVIAARYRQLWGELGERRRSASEEEWRGLRAWIPADARLFQGYGSQPFTVESVRASQQEPGDSLLSDSMNADLFDQLCLGQSSTVRAHLKASGSSALRCFSPWATPRSADGRSWRPWSSLAWLTGVRPPDRSPDQAEGADLRAERMRMNGVSSNSQQIWPMAMDAIR